MIERFSAFAGLVKGLRRFGPAILGAFALGGAASAQSPAVTISTPTIEAISADPTTATPGGQIEISFDLTSSSILIPIAVNVPLGDVISGMRVASSSTTCPAISSATVPTLGAATATWTGLQVFGATCSLNIIATLPLDAANGPYSFTGGTVSGTNASTSTEFGPVFVPATTFEVGADVVGPVPSLRVSESSIVLGESVTVFAEFDEGAFDIDQGDFVVTGGTVSNFAAPAGDLGVFQASFDVTPSGVGTISVELPAGTVEDDDGNPNSAAGPETVTVTAPDGLDFQAEVIDDPTEPGDTATIRYTLTNTNATTSVTSGSFTHGFGAALSGLTTTSTPVAGACGPSNNFSLISGGATLVVSGLELAPSASCQFDVQVTVPSGATPGTYRLNSNGLNYTLDGARAAPGVAPLLEVAGAEETGAPITFTKTFLPDSIQFTGATTLEYEITAAPGTSASNLAFTDDFTFAGFSLTPTDLPKSDICGAGSSLTASGNQVSLSGGVLAVDGTCSFTVELEAPASGAAGAVTSTTSALTGDQDGGSGAEPVAAGVTAGDALTVTDINPSVSVSGPEGGYVPASPFEVSFAFSEPVSDFVVGDISVANATLSNFSGDEANYTVTVTPISGTVSVSVPAGEATADRSGLTNLASNTYQISPVSGFAAPNLAVQASGASSAISNGASTASAATGTDFGQVASGPVTRTFTITNNRSFQGPAQAVIDSITVDDTTNYTISQIPSTIAVGASASFVVSYDPQDAGPHDATISILLDDSALNDAAFAANSLVNPFTFAVTGEQGAEPEINITGAGVSIASGDTTPSAGDDTDLGATLVGSPVTAIFTIENLGGAALELGADAVTVASGDVDAFSVTAQPGATIGAGGDDTFTIQFDAEAGGTYSAVISVANNDRDEAPYTFVVEAEAAGDREVELRGGGVEIVAGDTTPSAGDDTAFSEVVVGETASATFTILNTGDITLGLTPAPIDRDTGAPGGVTTVDVLSGSDDFTITAQPAASVSGGGSTTFTVQYAPSALGASDAVIGFGTDDADEPRYVFTVNGTGVSPEIAVAGLNDTDIGNGDTTPAAADGSDFGETGSSEGDPITRTFTITNSGDAVLNLGADAVSISGAAQSDFTVTTQPDASVAAEGGTTSFVISFDPSAEGLREAAVSIANDDLDESPFTFSIAGTGGDDTAPSGFTVAFDQDPILAADAGSISFTFAGGEVGADYDYSISSSGGGTPVTGSGTLATASDQVSGIDVSGLPDGTLTLSVTLTDTANNTGDAATDTVVKETDVPEVTLEFDAAQIGYNAPNGFTVTLDNSDSQLPVTINQIRITAPTGAVLVGANVSMCGGFSTITGGNLTLVNKTIPAGGVCTVTGTVRATNTTLGEQAFSFLLGSTSLGTPESTINSYETVVTNVSVADVTVEEGAGSVTITLTADRPIYNETAFEYAFADGTAIGGVDFELTSAAEIRFNDNSGVSVADGTSLIFDDALDEADETFSVTVTPPVSNGKFYSLTNDTATVTITDNDDAPVLSIADVTAGEGDGTATFTVSLDAASGQTVEVDYATSDDSAEAGSDYTAASATLTFDPGETTKTFDVTIAQDAISEGSEDFTVTLSGASNATIGDDEATGTITDDDAASVTIADVSADEDDGAVTVTATLDAAVQGGFTVDVSTADGTATTADSDYTAVTAQTLTFAGTAGETQTFTVTPGADSKLEADETLTVSMSNLTGAAGTVAITDTAEVTLTNDDMATVTIADVSGNEDDGAITLTATLDNPVAGGFTVDVSTADGTATTADSDYSAVTAQTLTFAGTAGETETFTVTPTSDVTPEDDESLTVSLGNLAGTTLPVDITDTASVGIDNDDTALISIADVTVNEGDGTATFTVSLAVASAQTITVDYATSDDSAEAGSDYTAASNTLTFDPGVTSQTFDVTITDDALDELNEAFTVTLTNPSNATISDDEATGTITDNDDAPSLGVAFTVTSVDEGVGTVTVNAQLSAPTALTVSADYRVVGATFSGVFREATAGEDFVAASGSVTFEPGETLKTVTVTLVDDALDEADEGLAAFFETPTNADLGPSGTQFDVVTITDNDAAPGLSIADVTSGEGDGTTTFTVTLDAPSGQTVTVDYATSDGTAEAGSDYTAASGTLTFDPGVTTRTFDVTLNEDALDEPSESFVATLSNPSSATLSDDEATGTLTDNDDAPSLSIADVTVGEGGGAATFTVSLDAPSAQTVTVDYATSNDTAEAGSDYDAASATLTFTPGVTSRTFDVAITDDALDELNETFVVTLSAPTNATLSDAEAAGVITDNDDVPTLNVSVSSRVDEGDGVVTYTVQLATPSALTATVDYFVTGVVDVLVAGDVISSSATVGEDFVANAGSLTFLPGETVKTVDVALIDDALDEPDEALSLILENPANVSLGGPSAVAAPLVITDNDDAPGLSIADVTVGEGDGPATFTVTLDAPSAQTITVDYATSNDTAEAGSDYNAASGTLTFTPGATSRTFDVSLIDDALDEPGETFTVTLSAPSNATLSDAEATGEIADNDDAPGLTIADVSAGEGDGTATFTVTLDAPSAQTITVDYATSDDGAEAGSDYDAASGTLTFTPGATSRTFDVTLIDDALDELDENFVVTLSTPTNATLSDAEAAGVITDNDDAPTLTIADVSLSENEGPATFTVTLGAVSGQSVTVDYATADGSAEAGSDYVAASGTLTFAPGVTVQTFDVAITNDGVVEDAETFTVTLTNPAAATIGEAEAIGTITNDDAAPSGYAVAFASDPITNAQSGAAGFSFTGAQVGADFTYAIVSSGGGSSVTGSGVIASAGQAVTGVDLSGLPDGELTLTAQLTDTFGNSGPEVTDTAAKETSLPGVTIATASADPVSGTFQITISFTEDVTGFALSDLSVSNGSAANLAGSGAAYTADVTPSADGTVTVDIAAGAATDSAGNPSVAAEQFSIESDGTAPGVTITTASADPVSGTFQITISFTEGVTGFEVGDLSVTNGAASNLAGSGADYTADIDPAADGTVTVTIAAGAATDAAGNASTAAEPFAIENDETAPGVTLTTSTAQPVSGAFTVSVAFTEPVSGFALADLVVGNGAASELSGSGAAYTVTITPSADGVVTVDLGAGAAADAAGNANTAAAQLAVETDATAPEATLSTASADPVSGAFTLNVDFSEPVTGLALADLGVSNGSASDLAGSGAAYTATITPDGDGTVTVTLPAGAAEDAAGNASLAAEPFSIESDLTAPGVALSTEAGDPVSGAFTLAITFTEPVTGLALDDLAVANGAASELQGSGAAYTALITPATDGTVTVDVAAGAASDTAGNASTAAEQFSIEADGSAPTVASITVSDADLRLEDVGDSFTLTIAFSEPVEGDGEGVVTFDADLAATLSTTEGALTDDGAAWVLTATVLDGGQSLEGVDVSVAGFADAAGNTLAEAEEADVFAVEMRRAGLQVSVEINGSIDGVFAFTGDLGVFEIATSDETGQVSFDDLAEGTYAFAIGDIEGFSLDSVSCADVASETDAASGSASVTLAPGETGLCVFALTADAGVDPDLEITLPPLTLPANITDPASVSVSFPLPNVGGVPLRYRIEVDVNWITITPSEGVIAPGESTVFTIALNDNVLDLAPGTYTATISVFNLSASGASGSAGGIGTQAVNTATIEIPITVTVEERFGSLTLIATTAPDIAGEGDFAFTSDIAEIDGAVLTTANGTARLGPLDVERGQYSIAQIAPEGWRLDTISCAGDADGGSVVDVAAGTLALDLDPEEAITCTFANVRDEAYVQRITTTAIRDFMAQRADQLLTQSPRIGERLRRGRAQAGAGFSADFTEGRFDTTFAASLASMREMGRAGDPFAEETAPAYAGFDLSNASAPGVLDVWIQASYTGVEDDRAGLASSNRFGLVYLGADLMISEDLLAGVLVQYDDMETETGPLRSRVDGEGWMAGPYMAMRLGEHLYFDARGAWGRSENTINPLGLYTDAFDTERWLLEANLAGDVFRGGWRITPEAGLAWFSEDSEAYIDSLGIPIEGQSVTLGRVRFGPEIAYRFEHGREAYVEPYVVFQTIYNFDQAEVLNAAGVLEGLSEFRADARLGLNAAFDNGARLTGELSVNGLGEGDLEATGAMIRLRTPLAMP
ncbi:MAG: Calx-beta domain-containing protein [Oceanicaulis sp.]